MRMPYYYVKMIELLLEEARRGNLDIPDDDEWMNNVAVGLHQQYSERTVDQWRSIVEYHVRRIIVAYLRRKCAEANLPPSTVGFNQSNKLYIERASIL